MDQSVNEPEAVELRETSLPALIVSFLRLGTTSFGGGNAGWTHREIVERRGWMSEENFLRTLTIAQLLPGANPVNLAVYIGLKLRGLAGAGAAALAMLAPAFVVIILMSLVYQMVKDYPESHSVLRGFACIGIATTLTMGVKTGRRLKGQYPPLLIAVLVFVLVGVLRWPLIPVVLGAIPLSIVTAYFMRKDRGNG